MEIVEGRRPPLAYSGIFIDTPNLEHIERLLRPRNKGGVTFNPPQMLKEGVYDLAQHTRDIIAIANKYDINPFSVSPEIPDTSWPIKKQVELGKRLGAIDLEKVAVKVGIDPDNVEKGCAVVYFLGEAGVRVNATLCTSQGQLVQAAESMRYSKAAGDNFISSFDGRIDEEVVELTKSFEQWIIQRREAGHDVSQYEYSCDLIYNGEQTIRFLRTYLLDKGLVKVRTVVGSVRHWVQINRAFNAGADIVTAPPDVIDKWSITKRGRATNKEFNLAARELRGRLILP